VTPLSPCDKRGHYLFFKSVFAHAVAFALRSEYIVRRAAELMIGNFYDEKKPHARAAFFNDSKDQPRKPLDDKQVRGIENIKEIFHTRFAALARIQQQKRQRAKAIPLSTAVVR
jgi:hypothetical protein